MVSEENAGVLILPEELKADDGTDFEKALLKAMTESASAVPLIVYGETAAMGCITWQQQHLGRPRWRVGEA